MRNLFLLLLTANLVVMAWNNWIADPAPVPVAPPADNLPALQLAAESSASAGQIDSQSQARVLEDPSQLTSNEDQRETPPRDRDIEAGSEASGGEAEPAVALVDQTQRCVGLGPFRDLSTAATAAASLRRLDIPSAQRVAQGEIWAGYWVHMSGLASRDVAREVLTGLRENGITDSYIVPGGDNDHTISLGVFREESRAEQRTGSLRELGFEVELSERFRTGTVYWVDFELAPEQKVDLKDFESIPGRIVRMVEKNCSVTG